MGIVAGYTDKLRKAADRVMEPGEQLLAGARAMSAGSTARIVGTTAGAVAGGAAGFLVADKLTSGSGTDQALELPAQVAVGLTDRRLLVFKRGGLSGAAKDLVAQLRREDIAAVQGEDSGSKLRPDRLTVRLVDGSTVDFEIVKADGFQHVVDAFAAG